MDQKPTVLVTDDEKIIREGCTRILSKDDYDVLVTENGQEALEVLLRERVDIMLLDLKMPLMDGMAVLREIEERKLDPLVIIITGHGTIETAVQSMKRGAYDFITKPFSPDQLRLAVKRAWERKRLEREAEFLREERARSIRDIATEKSRISTIIQAMTDGVLITDSGLEVLLNNAAAARLLGLEPTVLRGAELLSATRNAALAEMAGQVLNPADPSITSITKEIEVGDDGLVRASTGVVKDERGQPMGTVTVLQDLSHIKELDKMKSEFVAMVVHELRAPLAAIRQTVDLLLTGVMGTLEQAQTELLDRVSKRSTGLLSLINNLLDLSKMDAGKLVLSKEPVDMGPITRRVVELLAPRAKEKNLHLVLDVPETLPLILADPVNMEGVVTNLVSNAIRYNVEEGRLEVRASAQGDFLVIEVSDTGIGISKEDLPRIFDRFYRVRSAKTRAIAGTGLGLPIVQGIVRAHLGTIEVSSEPDRGATFRVMIPLLADAGETPAAEE